MASWRQLAQTSSTVRQQPAACRSASRTASRPASRPAAQPPGPPPRRASSRAPAHRAQRSPTKCAAKWLFRYAMPQFMLAPSRLPTALRPVAAGGGARWWWSGVVCVACESVCHGRAGGLAVRGWRRRREAAGQQPGSRRRCWLQAQRPQPAGRAACQTGSPLIHDGGSALAQLSKLGRRLLLLRAQVRHGKARGRIQQADHLACRWVGRAGGQAVWQAGQVGLERHGRQQCPLHWASSRHAASHRCAEMALPAAGHRQYV